MSSSLSLRSGVVAGLLVIGLAAGCDPIRYDAKSAHDAGGGRSRLYAGSYEQTWAAAHAAVSWNRAGAVTDHPDQHYFITDDVHFDQIGMWLLPFGADKTQVTVVVMDDRRTGPNEMTLLTDTGTALDRIKSGQPIDQRP